MKMKKDLKWNEVRNCGGNWTENNDLKEIRTTQKWRQTVSEEDLSPAEGIMVGEVRKRKKAEGKVSRVWYGDNKNEFQPIALLNFPLMTTWTHPAVQLSIEASLQWHTNTCTSSMRAAILKKKGKSACLRAADIITSLLILEYLALFSLAMQFNFKAHETKAIHLTPVFPAGERAGSTAGTRKHILCLQVNLVALKVYTAFYTLSGLPKIPINNKLLVIQLLLTNYSP